MYEILEKKVMSETVKFMKIKAPLVAKKALAGQFIMLRIDEKGERIPLTIADYDQKEGVVDIIFMEVGNTTRKLGNLKKGDSVLNLVGPLGTPTDIKTYGSIVCIGGGVGIAPLFPIVRELKKAGNYVIELHVSTDDGTKGHKGFVSDLLQRIIDDKRRIDAVWAIGPVIMMKVVSDLTRKYKIKTFVSLNSIMVDGTGMCGSCRVSVGGVTLFACVDGPEFDGHLVDFDNLMLRNQQYICQEKESYKRAVCAL
jgi:ferredoxin--NADP+ reductase